jgi:beta-glucosidase
MKTISQPLDFFGMNCYQSGCIKTGTNGEPELVKPLLGNPRTTYNWPVTPSAMYWGPRYSYERYGKPVLITENGMGNVDWVSMDGKVHDPQRIDFTRRYLLEYRRAADDGVPLMGYFNWSVMDNFEWNLGYQQRFGLVHVDFQTQKRTLKDSAYWYRDVIACNGENLVQKV